MSPEAIASAPLKFAAHELPKNATPADLRAAAKDLLCLGGWMSCFDVLAGAQVERAACTLAIVAFFSWGGRPRLLLIRGGK